MEPREDRSKSELLAELAQVEMALLKSQHFIQEVFNSIQDGICILDPDLTIRSVNRVMEQWYADDAPLEGKKCFECFHNRSAPCSPCPTLRCIETRQTQRNVIPGYPGSSVEWIELFCYPMIDEASAEVTGILEFVRDITSRKEAERALRESEEKYRLLVEKADEAIFVAQEERIKFSNPKAVSMLGFSRHEIENAPFSSFIHEADRQLVLDRHRRRLSGEAPPESYRFRIRNQSGAELLVELSTMRISWEGRPATLNFLRDITKQQRIEEQMQRAQRMESIGTLAGGVAHDFNNLLTGIQGRTELIRGECEAGRQPALTHLQAIEEHVQSAMDLSKQLLGLAQGGKYEVLPTDVNGLVASSLKLFGRMGKELTIRKRLARDLWSAEVDRVQIEQVLLNLFVNAWQAMPEGGELCVETANAILDADEAAQNEVEPGRFVRVAVADSGIGMDQATRERIFDPFFTTKEMGRGTGLGLASSYGILRNHGGCIDVTSQPGQGATFTFYLPASSAEPAAKAQAGDAVAQGAETILLVDDEAMVREVGQELLEAVGYRVLAAANGREALGLYARHQKGIDLVLLDLVMAEMNGKETYYRLRELDGNVRVLLTSGYSSHEDAPSLLRDGCAGFIQKPYRVEDLSRKIREILDS
jgi:PAS domain S-box-containing protein